MAWRIEGAFAAKTSICEVLQKLFGRHGNLRVSDNSSQGQEMRVKKATELPVGREHLRRSPTPELINARRGLRRIHTLYSPHFSVKSD